MNILKKSTYGIALGLIISASSFAITYDGAAQLKIADDFANDGNIYLTGPIADQLWQKMYDIGEITFSNSPIITAKYGSRIACFKSTSIKCRVSVGQLSNGTIQ